MSRGWAARFWYFESWSLLASFTAWWPGLLPKALYCGHGGSRGRLSSWWPKLMKKERNELEVDEWKRDKMEKEIGSENLWEICRKWNLSMKNREWQLPSKPETIIWGDRSSHSGRFPVGSPPPPAWGRWGKDGASSGQVPPARCGAAGLRTGPLLPLNNFCFEPFHLSPLNNWCEQCYTDRTNNGGFL